MKVRLIQFSTVGDLPSMGRLRVVPALAGGSVHCFLICRASKVGYKCPLACLSPQATDGVSSPAETKE